MKRTAVHPAALLLASAALTLPLAAQQRPQEPSKDPAKVERVQEAPKHAAPAGGVRKAEPPKAEVPAPEVPNAEAREIAKKAAHFEAVHRDRIARIDRLIVIYTGKGDRAKVAELEALRDGQMKRHTNAMEGFRKQLGGESWGRFEQELKRPRVRARKTREEHQDANDKERTKEEPPARDGGKK